MLEFEKKRVSAKKVKGRYIKTPLTSVFALLSRNSRLNSTKAHTGIISICFTIFYFYLMDFIEGDENPSCRVEILTLFLLFVSPQQVFYSRFCDIEREVKDVARLYAFVQQMLDQLIKQGGLAHSSEAIDE